MNVLICNISGGSEGQETVLKTISQLRNQTELTSGLMKHWFLKATMPTSKSEQNPIGKSQHFWIFTMELWDFGGLERASTLCIFQGISGS